MSDASSTTRAIPDTLAAGRQASRELTMASQRVRARFENGVFKPLEPVDLLERQEVTLAIQAERSGAVGAAEFVPNPNWGKQADGRDLIELLYEARRLGSREPPAS